MTESTRIDFVLIEGNPYLLCDGGICDPRSRLKDAEIAEDLRRDDPFHAARRFIDACGLKDDLAERALEIAYERSLDPVAPLSSTEVLLWAERASGLAEMLTRCLAPTRGRDYLDRDELARWAEALTRTERLDLARKIARICKTHTDEQWPGFLLAIAT